MLITFAIFCLSVLYIYQVVSKTTEEYSLQREEGRILALRTENKELVTRIAKANSLNNLAVMVEEDLGFEQIDAMRYIELSNNQIAERGK